jgi:predicted DNA-binding ArsR family transcriptional regulator
MTEAKEELPAEAKEEIPAEGKKNQKTSDKKTPKIGNHYITVSEVNDDGSLALVGTALVHTEIKPEARRLFNALQHKLLTVKGVDIVEHPVGKNGRRQLPEQLVLCDIVGEMCHSEWCKKHNNNVPETGMTSYLNNFNINFCKTEEVLEVSRQDDDALLDSFVNDEEIVKDTAAKNQDAQSVIDDIDDVESAWDF